MAQTTKFNGVADKTSSWMKKLWTVKQTIQAFYIDPEHYY